MTWSSSRDAARARPSSTSRDSTFAIWNGESSIVSATSRTVWRPSSRARILRASSSSPTESGAQLAR